MKIERKNIPSYDNRAFGANTVKKDITTRKQMNTYTFKKEISEPLNHSSPQYSLEEKFLQMKH